MSEKSIVQDPLIKYSTQIGWTYLNRDEAVSSLQLVPAARRMMTLTFCGMVTILSTYLSNSFFHQNSKNEKCKPNFLHFYMKPNNHLNNLGYNLILYRHYITNHA